MSASISASSVIPPRSHTPALHSASAYARSQTPSIRSYTPAPSAIPPVPRLSTPAPPSMTMRTQTPVPLVPPKPRRLSQPPSPPKMFRSTSEEKADAHERWLPPTSADENDYHPHKYKSSTPRPPSRSAFSISRLLS
jgi:hypothetical protein